MSGPGEQVPAEPVPEEPDDVTTDAEQTEADPTEPTAEPTEEPEQADRVAGRPVRETQRDEPGTRTFPALPAQGAGAQAVAREERGVEAPHARKAAGQRHLRHE